ncbi:MAG: type 4a pilus biogenesis protein PilO [Alphaproteobacteria bacterium]|nr:type 4a pilus biogenesis protein PilO [Alphaproteobacteria bacterium]
MTAADLLDKIAQLPRSQRLGLWALLVLLVPVLFFVLLFSPASQELGTLEDQQVELKAEYDKVKVRAENRERFEAELLDLTNMLKQALRELPNDREIPDLLKRISTVGKKAGLEMQVFRPLPEVIREYYAEVPVQLQVQGSYHEVAVFFDRLSKLGRIVSVEEILMQNPSDAGGKVYLQVQGKVVTYRFLTDEERAKQSEKTERKGKKGKNK